LAAGSTGAPPGTSGEQTREADLPTEQIGAQAPPRFPEPHGDQGRPQGAQRPPDARPEAPQRLIAGKLAAPVEKLRKRADFLGAATGPRAPAAAFVLQTGARADNGPPRVGFTVSKKVGNAVERNRVRRRLREIVRLSDAGRLRPGNDYVLIGRRAALDLPFERLIEDFARALERIHQQRRGPRQPNAHRGGD
jgi:ribonuclease P protein component